jgi:NAD(P)H-flavin reductase
MTLVRELPAVAPSAYVPLPARVERVEALTATEKRFTIRLPGGEPLGHRPGQFVQVSLFGIGEAPISVCSPPLGQPEFQITVRRIGNVTEALHRLEPGAGIGIRGPYGTGFDVAELEGKDLLFVAGGIGLAPLRSLVAYVADPARRKRFGRAILLYGARNPGELLFADEVDAWTRAGIDVRVTVDRAGEDWPGRVGVVTTLFEGLEVDRSNTVVAVVGPPVMYRFVLLEIFGKGIPFSNIRLSLERRMKCGIGVCGHCQINGLYVCRDGPVFRYTDIRSLDEAI